MANAGKTVIVAALDGTFQRKVSRSNNIPVSWLVYALLLYDAPGYLIVGLWEYLAAGPLGRERGETKCCLYGVLSWGFIYKEAGSREGGTVPVYILKPPILDTKEWDPLIWVNLL